MIKARSPYYVPVQFLSPLTGVKCTKYILKIKMWRGEASDVPASSNYEMTRYNYNSSSGSEDVDISAIIYSFLESTYTNVSDGVFLQETLNQGRARIEAEYFTSNGSDTGVDQLLQNHSIFLGYGFGNEGKNTSVPSSHVLINGNIHKCSNDSIFIVPILSTDYTKTVTIASTPLGIYSRSYTVPSSFDSSEFCNLVCIDTSLVGSDNRVNINISGTKLLLVLDHSNKYKNSDVHFINQYGVQQCISMNKERVEGLTVKRSEYERYTGQPNEGYHQFNTFLSNGRSNISLSSGYLSEGQNKAFKELLLSQSIWIDYDGEVLPVSIKTSNLSYKTVANDSVINYDIEFQYAFNEINNV